MRRIRSVSLVLLSAGAAALAVAAVRIGLFWVIDPLNDALVPAASLLLAGGLATGVLSLRRLRRRPFRAAGVLAVAGLLLGGLVRVVVDLPSDAEGTTVVLYGPGGPPSVSWSLLWWQVGGPVLAVAAYALLTSALAAAIAGVARAVAARLRPA